MVLNLFIFASVVCVVYPNKASDNLGMRLVFPSLLESICVYSVHIDNLPLQT